MDIQLEKMLQYRYHLGMAIIASLVLSLLLYAAPRLVGFLAYFWPLLASTTVFLVLIIAFGGVSAPLPSHGERAGEGLLEYVAAAHQQPQGDQPQN